MTEVECKCFDNGAYNQKWYKLDHLIQRHFQELHRANVKLKKKLHKANMRLEEFQSRCNVLSEKLATRSNCENLMVSPIGAGEPHVEGCNRCRESLHIRMKELETQTRYLEMKSEACEHWEYYLGQREDELVAQKQQLELMQASVEGDPILARRRSGLERECIKVSDGGAENFLHNANFQAARTSHCKWKMGYFIAAREACFNMEKDEYIDRMSIMHEEIFLFSHIVSLRLSDTVSIERRVTDHLSAVGGDVPLNEPMVMKEADNSGGDQLGKTVESKDQVELDCRGVLESMCLVNNDWTLGKEQYHLEKLKRFEELLSLPLVD
uniref:Uncharacterized protein n=1 Tax=Trypanosoma congolense (strain IL3000) TaxID=1068625 RepID=G0UW25_TRYCI|nr:conserved hypothetical protein [Trypanosoma congolense IL3000]